MGLEGLLKKSPIYDPQKYGFWKNMVNMQPGSLIDFSTEALHQIWTDFSSTRVHTLSCG